MPLHQKNGGIFERNGKRYRVTVFVERESPAVYRVVGERLGKDDEAELPLYCVIRSISESHSFVETDPVIRQIIDEARDATVYLDK